MFFTNLYKNGLTKRDDALTLLRVILINLTILLSVPFLTGFLIFYVLEQNTKFSLFFGGTALMFVLIYVLNKKRKFRLSSQFLLVTICFILGFITIQYGRGGGSQGNFGILVLFGFVFSNNKWESIAYFILTFGTWFFSYFYLELYGPLEAIRPIKYDYFINMGFTMIGMGVLAYVFIGTLKSYIIQKEQAFNILEKNALIIKKQRDELELFTSIASHDLKTPIRTISAFLGLIEKNESFNDPKSKEYLNIAKSGSLQLHSLVTGLSIFNKLENKSNDSKNEAKTSDIIKEVLQNLRFENKPNIKVTYTDIPDLKMNETHLYHIFQNLIQNGIKYNESPVKTIHISHELSNKHIYIRFKDNGIGIAPEYKDYIFEPFKKIHSSKKYESTGLGLAICSKIVSFYNAKIELESLDVGSLFKVIIPIEYVLSEQKLHSSQS